MVSRSFCTKYAAFRHPTLATTTTATKQPHKSLDPPHLAAHSVTVADPTLYEE